MLQKSKITTYLLYAVGEITLVVLGILIAVQIDNWNEKRKESKIELEILKALRTDLIKNEAKIKLMIRYDSTVVACNTILLAHLNNPASSFHDSLKYYFGRINSYMVFFPQKMAYENLKSKGLDIISNDSLRSKLVELYDETYYHSQHIGERKAQINYDSKQVFNKHLYTIARDGKEPNNFNELKNNAEFKNTVSDITADRASTLYQSRGMLKNTITLYKLIDKEIQN